MPYRLRITETAKADLRSLPGHLRQRARRIVDGLVENPTPPGSKQLRDLPDHYRLRLLTWRIIYRVDGETVLILTVREKSGPETYQDLEGAPG
jgi:mRNA interferase RelE/StbE